MEEKFGNVRPSFTISDHKDIDFSAFKKIMTVL